VKAETMRFRRKRLAILAAVCVVIGLPFVLGSHRGATAFGIGATLIGIGVGLLAVALLFSPLSRLDE
jgi:hypothetical protein